MEQTTPDQAGTTQPLLTIRSEASTTEWRDPWEATKEARKVQFRNRDKDQFQRDLFTVSKRITDEINADPLEVQRLREARKDAREGKASPRRDGTKSS